MAKKLLKFAKYHGTGNDIIIVNGIKNAFLPKNDTIKWLCDRRFGIGADQLLLLLQSKKADFRVRIFNKDGSEAEMCGNGLRCLAKYLVDKKFTQKNELNIETPAGIIRVRKEKKDYNVDMGKPKLDGKDIPVNLNGMVVNRNFQAKDKTFKITCVSMGNPHCVIFVDNLELFPVRLYGPLIEKSPIFPKGVNVEFVSILNKKEVKMRVWERGAGETLACGSGACASVVSSILNGKTDKKVKVRLLGGDLTVTWGKDEHVYLSGPAVEVYSGEIEI
ncbi:MAG TPA: diaminopimelate epimerase [bacterium]